MKNFHSASSYLKLHEPLPWDVLDGRGQPLLRKGYVIDSQDQLEALLQRGAYVARSRLSSRECLRKASRFK